VLLCSISDGPPATDSDRTEWDIYAIPSSDECDHNSPNKCQQAFKVIMSVLVFAVVLTSTVFSNGALLLAASNLAVNEVNGTAVNCTACRYLSLNETCEDVYRVKWAWSLFLMLCLPYAFVVIRNLNRVVSSYRVENSRTKKFSSKDYWVTLGIVMLIETMHAAGVVIFVFNVLPAVDNVVEVSNPISINNNNYKTAR